MILKRPCIPAGRALSSHLHAATAITDQPGPRIQAKLAGTVWIFHGDRARFASGVFMTEAAGARRSSGGRRCEQVGMEGTGTYGLIAGPQIMSAALRLSVDQLLAYTPISHRE
jgi:hypothetical protein